MADRSRLIVAGMLVLAAVIGGAAVAIGTGALRGGGDPVRVATTDAEASVLSAAEAAPASSSVASASDATPASTPSADANAPAALPPGAAKLIDQKQFGDWIYSCTETASAAKSCSILQQLNDAKSGILLFQWRIVRAGDGRLIAVWQTPTGVLIGRGIVLDAGTPNPIAVPFNSCNAHNCDAVATLAADFQAALKAATNLKATIASTDNRNLVFTFSSKGLAAAMTALGAG